MGPAQSPLTVMTAADPANRSRGIVRALAVGWMVVALALVVLSPMSAWATTPPTDETHPPSTSSPDNSSSSSGSSTSSASRIEVPTWMFVAGGVLIFVAAAWMVQANRRRA